MSFKSNAVGPSQIGTTELADNSVTSTDILDGNVTNDRLQTNTAIITSGNGMSNMVGSVPLGGTLNVNLNTVSGHFTYNGFNQLTVASGAVTGGNLTNISGNKIATQAITSNLVTYTIWYNDTDVTFSTTSKSFVTASTLAITNRGRPFLITFCCDGVMSFDRWSSGALADPPGTYSFEVGLYHPNWGDTFYRMCGTEYVDNATYNTANGVVFNYTVIADIPTGNISLMTRMVDGTYTRFYPIAGKFRIKELVL